MNLIKAILINEIKDAIGHKPSKDEFKSCLKYIKDLINEHCIMTDVGLSIIDWRDDNCFKCDHCEEWFLTDQLQETDDGKFCSDECESEYKINQMSDDELKTY